MPLRVVAVFLAGSVLCAQVNFYSKEKEAALGAQLAGDFRRRTTAVDSPAIQSYVARLGEKLAAQFNAGAVSYTFTVVADSLAGRIHEPLSLPGGYVFVSTDLLTAAENESELAGVLAHAMAHIANRDGARLATAGQVINYGSIPLIFVGGWAGSDNEHAALPLGFLKIQRSYELQADRDAVRAMSGAGYDPRALLAYVTRLQSSDSLFSPLPPRDERLKSLETAIRELPLSDFALIREEILASEPQRPAQPLPSLFRQGERH